MLFNSIDFAIFLPIVFALYWIIGPQRMRVQNLLLLIASYIFYGWWDEKFLLLIVFSSFVDFFVGQLLNKTEAEGRRKLLLLVSLVVNLGMLMFFKYFNFFLDNFIQAFSFFGTKPNITTLKIILPVGISFYTFQTLSYTIDVYRKKLQPTNDFIGFFAYVSFFPQLVAGPIERASNLLPQFSKQRQFSYEDGREGLRLILWGLFKKVVIADTCAIYANDIFSNYQEYSSPLLLLGAFYFAFQIYGDFSGYSDIAIGTARLFGFKLMRNFAYPYFSRDIAEFWRRWHISLSTWFRDYLYIPLGGSRGSKGKKIRNVMIIFVVSGFWHGANWTFIIWGFLNALYFLPLLLSNKNRRHLGEVSEGQLLPSFLEFRQILITFTLTLLAWIFFRANSLTHAFDYLWHIVNFSFRPIFINKYQYVPLVLAFVAWEWLMRKQWHGLAINHLPTPIRWGIYLGMIWMILYFFGEEQAFIYFQF